MKNRNNKRSVGRPSVNLVFPRGPFTIAQLIDANPNVCALTCRIHVDKALSRKFLKLMKETVHTGNVGKPAYQYTQTAMGQKKLTILKRTRTVKAKAVEAPVVPATPVAVEHAPAPSIEIPIGIPAPIVAVVATPAPVAEAVPA